MIKIFSCWVSFLTQQLNYLYIDGDNKRIGHYLGTFNVPVDFLPIYGYPWLHVFIQQPICIPS